MRRAIKLMEGRCGGFMIRLEGKREYDGKNAVRGRRELEFAAVI